MTILYPYATYSSANLLSPTDGVDGPNGISVPQYGS